MVKFVLIAILTLSNGQEVGPSPLAEFDSIERCEKAGEALEVTGRGYDTICVERRAS